MEEGMKEFMLGIKIVPAESRKRDVKVNLSLL